MILNYHSSLRKKSANFITRSFHRHFSIPGFESKLNLRVKFFVEFFFPRHRILNFVALYFLNKSKHWRNSLLKLTSIICSFLVHLSDVVKSKIDVSYSVSSIVHEIDRFISVACSKSKIYIFNNNIFPAEG